MIRFIFTDLNRIKKKPYIEMMDDNGRTDDEIAGEAWENYKKRKNGILLPKLFWPTVRKNCSSDRENFLKFEAEGREFAKILRSLEQFIRTVKCQNNVW